jgi:hypothetical protein
MLLFEEETSKEALIAQAKARLPASPPFPESSAAGPSTHSGRINALNQRVINGRTDVNQLVPFKYRWPGKNTWRAAPITGCRRKSRWAATSPSEKTAPR